MRTFRSRGRPACRPHFNDAAISRRHLTVQGSPSHFTTRSLRGPIRAGPAGSFVIHFRIIRFPGNGWIPSRWPCSAIFPCQTSPVSHSRKRTTLPRRPILAFIGTTPISLRVDHKFSERHRIFVMSTANWGVEYRNGNGFPVPALRGEWPKHRNHYMDTFDDVLTISSSTLLNVRVSYDRFN